MPTPTQVSQEELLEFRRVVADAIAELRSQERRDSFSALSLEELVDQHIEDLEGDDPEKPGRLVRLRKVRDSLREHLAALKEIPPDVFLSTSSDDAETT